MTVGICILAHDHLYRVEQLARHLATNGCRVAVHIDKRCSDAEFSKLHHALSDLPEILFQKRTRCEWGTFALHDAALETARTLIDTYEDVSHVTLVSGSCIPVRPIAELEAHLKQNPNTDFVESNIVGIKDWVQEGLAEERFTLYFPFGWRSQRWLFDKFVDLQRKLHVQRRAPEYLTLAMGSQWWTLCRGTLRAILDDPRKEETDRFFKKCWIVDESYIQSLVRTHSVNLINKSLCLTEFDPQGKPFTFYDDHAHLLEETESFFARKVWHGADGLYNRYINGVTPLAVARRPRTESLKQIIARGRDLRCVGRPGLVMQSRFPVQAHERQHSTARRYMVLDGYDALFDGMPQWLEDEGIEGAHGRIFAKDRVEFSGNGDTGPGGIVANPRIRNWNTEQFLTHLIWNRRESQQAFLFHVSDTTRMASFILKDPNADIFLIRGAYSLMLEPQIGETANDFRRRAKKMRRLEEKHLAEIKAPTTRANVQIFDLQEVVRNPALPLAAVANAIENRAAALNEESLPQLRSAYGLSELTARMRNAAAADRKGQIAAALGKLASDGA
ncbi:DUF5927 domain-containing protein [Pontivivens insulae]|uniref:Peptide O-xylosyltransferase n=1 Tax=Pontivivens insulae TaxID=1639689 RepID=A0A2R8A8L5_9RHOB|nr:beta-1,6-N-acetylglucosaminyltransferase [Pontivivens insulae]RED18492.1 core-2/I-Branching enzyme [Pontivivens insulae]SPF28390.1 hypothetical protein POI8812_00689 [Pontivivens insulae]